MYSTDRESRRGGSEFALCVCICYCLVLFLLFVVLPTTIVVTLSKSNDASNPAQNDDRPNAARFSPGDSRIISYGSTFFCAAVRFQSTNNVGFVLQPITDTPPRLTDRHNFTINALVSSRSTMYWNYYLHQNSNFATKICTRQSSSGDWVFLLVKGRSNFLSWIRNPASGYGFARDHFLITDFSCSRGVDRHYSFRVGTDDADEYFLVYYNRYSSNVQLEVTISVERFEYALSSNQLTSYCLDGSGTCLLHLQLGSSHQTLMVVEIPSNVNWEEGVDIDWHCETPRTWAYIVVVLGPISVVTVATVIACVCLIKKRRRRLQSTDANEPGVQVQAMKETQNSDPLNGEQDLTAIPPPSYAASLAYPLPTDEDKSSPPSYIECTTNNV